MPLTFPLTATSTPAPSERIAEIHADPGFGVYFTDHMAVATWRKDGGWSDDAVVPYGPFQLDPSTAVLHYAQEVFEGLKAYRHADGSIWLFRPERNAERLNASARRLMLPELPVDDFLTSIEQLVTVDAAWVPDAPVWAGPDATGAHQVFVHATKDQSVMVGGSHTVTVGADRTDDVKKGQSFTIDGTQTTSVGGDQKITIGADGAILVKGARSETIGGDEAVTVTGIPPAALISSIASSASLASLCSTMRRT